MHKIPVGPTISAAYGFAFQNFLSLLGIVWLPYALLVAIIAGAVYGLAPELPGQIMRGEIDMSVFMSIRRIEGIVWIAAIIAGAMVTVGLQQKALGQLQGPNFFYFSLGAPVWYMIGAYILAIIAIVVIVIVAAIVAAIIVFGGVKFVPQYRAAIIAITVIATACWVIYASVRLVFFLPAVVVAEKHIGLVRSWELGGGNFWRMFAVWFVVFVPVAIGFGAIFWALVIPFISLPDIAQHFGHPKIPADVMKGEMATLGYFFKQMRGVLPIIFVLDIIYRVILLGLANGMIANAYLGVTSGENANSGGHM